MSNAYRPRYRRAYTVRIGKHGRTLRRSTRPWHWMPGCGNLPGIKIRSIAKLLARCTTIGGMLRDNGRTVRKCVSGDLDCRGKPINAYISVVAFDNIDCYAAHRVGYPLPNHVCILYRHRAYHCRRRKWPLLGQNSDLFHCTRTHVNRCDSFRIAGGLIAAQACIASVACVRACVWFAGFHSQIVSSSRLPWSRWYV